MSKQIVSPARFAQLECCCWVGGTCVGVGWRGCQPGAKDGRPCVLTKTEPGRCQFFERAVLPQAVMKPQYAHAERAYLRKHPVKSRQGAGNFCIDCGRRIRPRKRYCQECQTRRRRQAYRAEKARQRR